jgi:zinc/manganese transport system permease protein
MIAMVGGTLLALGGSLPISPYVTTVSFLLYLLARLIEKMKVKA